MTVKVHRSAQMPFCSALSDEPTQLNDKTRFAHNYAVAFSTYRPKDGRQYLQADSCCHRLAEYVAR